MPAIEQSLNAKGSGVGAEGAAAAEQEGIQNGNEEEEEEEENEPQQQQQQQRKKADEEEEQQQASSLLPPSFLPQSLLPSLPSILPLFPLPSSCPPSYSLLPSLLFVDEPFCPCVKREALSVCSYVNLGFLSGSDRACAENGLRQLLDADGSGGLVSHEPCAALRKLVSLHGNYAQAFIARDSRHFFLARCAILQCRCARC